MSAANNRVFTPSPPWAIWGLQAVGWVAVMLVVWLGELSGSAKVLLSGGCLALGGYYGATRHQGRVKRLRIHAQQLYLVPATSPNDDWVWVTLQGTQRLLPFYIQLRVLSDNGRVLAVPLVWGQLPSAEFRALRLALRLMMETHH